MRDLNPRNVLDQLHDALGAFYAGGDDEPVKELLSADVEWHVSGRSSIARDYRGADAVLAYFTKRRDLAGKTFRMHPSEVLVGEGHIAVITDGSAVIAGKAHEWSTVGLYRIRDGRIAAAGFSRSTLRPSIPSGLARPPDFSGVCGERWRLPSSRRLTATRGRTS